MHWKDPSTTALETTPNYTKWYVIQALSFRHDFDGNGNEGSVNYSDGNEGSSKISMAVRGGKISNGTEELALKPT